MSDVQAQQLTDSSTTKSPGRFRWQIGGLLGAGMFVNYIDRVNLSVATPAIMDDFNISAAQMGVLASAFLWTYALLQMPIGSIIDKIGVPWVNRVGVFLWALASFLAAAAGGLGLMIAARLMLGVGEAPTVPAGWKAIGQWFPKQERGTATAIFDGCAKLSNVIGIPIMAFLVSTFSWHAAFLFTGVLVKRIYGETDSAAVRFPQIAFAKAGYLRDHPKVIEAFLDRIDECETGAPVMNCQLCKYRTRIVGHDAAVGAPQQGHHHHVRGAGVGHGDDRAHGHDHSHTHEHRHSHHQG